MKGWVDIGARTDIPLRGARRVQLGRTPIAVFRTGDDALFALIDRCPHKGGPLSQGIVHGHAVACPLHNWVISLETGQAQGADSGCATAVAIKEKRGRLLINASAFVAMAPS